MFLFHVTISFSLFFEDKLIQFSETVFPSVLFISLSLFNWNWFLGFVLWLIDLKSLWKALSAQSSFFLLRHIYSSVKYLKRSFDKNLRLRQMDGFWKQLFSRYWMLSRNTKLSKTHFFKRNAKAVQNTKSPLISNISYEIVFSQSLGISIEMQSY